MNFRSFFTGLTCFFLIPALAACSHQVSRKGVPETGKLTQQNTESTPGLSHYILGVYSEDIGELDSAITEYKKALESDPDSSLLHLNLASAFIKKNEFPLAIKELKQSISISPLDVEPHAILALLYAAQNEKELATREYTVALKNASRLDPKNIEIYKSLGAVYLQQKKLKEAEGIFKLVTGLSPQDAEAHFFLGSIFFELKDFSSVEKELKSALKLNPDYPEALNFLGYFYLERNENIERAGSMIKKALEFDPENGAYIDSLGWYYFKKGNLKAALAQLEKAASLLSDPEIYDHLGEVFLKLDKREQARSNWEKSLKLDPSQNKIKEKLKNLNNHGR